MSVCNYSNMTKEEWKSKANGLYKLWKELPNITNRFSDRDGTYNGLNSFSAMTEYLQQRLKVPFDSEYVFSENQISRAKTEIKHFDKMLSGKFSNMAWYVPEGISKQDPIVRKFYLKLNNILNYERTALNKNMMANAFIANSLFDAYAGKGVNGKAAIKKIRLMREKMMTEDDFNIDAFAGEMEKFLESDGGVIIKDYIDLIHMDGSEFKKAPSTSYRTKEGKERSFDSHVIQAAKKTREHLKDTGKIYLNGLTELQKMVAVRYTGQSNIQYAQVHSRNANKEITKLKEAAKSIETRMAKDEGYYPHIVFQDMVDLKKKLSASFTNKNNTKVFESVIDDIVKNASSSERPEHTRGVNELIKTYWEKDPMFIINEYGAAAASFNKLMHTQRAYLEAMKSIPKDNDMEFVVGMKRFIAEEYAVFTKGKEMRSEFANGMVRGLNSLQTARTMGLNITGAVKNAASAIHYYSHAGFKLIGETVKAVHDTQSDFHHIIKDVENEAGFLFKDVAQELYSEGTISKEKYDESRIEFNPVTGKVLYNKTPLKDIITKAEGWTLDKLLIFHRITENSQRKWMFRTAFYKQYTMLINNGYPPEKAKKFAKEGALQEVNAWAYEYAAHAKSKLVRGEWRTIDEIEEGTISTKLKGEAGAMSEVAFHLMHYPMSLFESHYSQLKGAHKALLSKQYDAEELHYAMRYAGISSLLGLIGVAINTNLFNIFENETQERVQRITDDIMFANSKKATFGLLAEVSGPTLGTLKYFGIAGGLLDISNDGPTLNKILFGNVDYADKNNKDVQRYSAYQLSTEWGVLKHKLIPALQSRRPMDLIRHTFKLYPADYTRKYNEKIFGISKGEKKKAAQKRAARIERLNTPNDKKSTNIISLLDKIEKESSV